MSQLRGPSQDRDSRGTYVDVIQTSVTHRDREREQGGGESSREALGWGLEA